MKFCCYSCGLEFSKGLPPMEALSLDQLAAVMDDDFTPEIRHDLLFGTKFEGMSTYNFCTFCLTAIRDFPLAMENKNDVPGHKMQMSSTTMGLTCECGYFHRTGQKFSNQWNPDGERLDTVLANRVMVMHVIAMLYADADTTEILSLINKEA